MTLAIMILPTDHANHGGGSQSCPGFLPGRKLWPWSRTVSAPFSRWFCRQAVPGILAGIILAVGRIVGETAALMYTAGTVAGIPSSLFGSGRTLAVHMYVLTNEGLYTNQSYATAVVLLVIVVCNQCSIRIYREESCPERLLKRRTKWISSQSSNMESVLRRFSSA